MSDQQIIECSGVGKRFLKMSRTRYFTHLLQFHRVAQKNWLWVLDKVDLSLQRGQRLGIIGANGSGKTTLLRILAGVTVPTSGRVVVNGRIAPLLEPVSGIQPDLTGRENIYLLGTILGMRRREIRKKFDAVVDFSGISSFLDMPTKHYSLGMIMRLGFSVAIHVDADILLVDEAWSISDVAFQNKSLERLKRLHQNHATILMVSHDLEIIQTETDRTLWLKEGRVAALGPSGSVVASYLKSISP